jgi:hypothetical protein
MISIAYWCRESSFSVCCRTNFWCWGKEIKTSIGFSGIQSNCGISWFVVSSSSCCSLTVYVFLKLCTQTFIYLHSRELTTEHKRLAEIIEMIHTASLIHDDVIDDSGMRRGTLCYYVQTNQH